MENNYIYNNIQIHIIYSTMNATKFINQARKYIEKELEIDDNLINFCWYEDGLEDVIKESWKKMFLSVLKYMYMLENNITEDIKFEEFTYEQKLEVDDYLLSKLDNGKTKYQTLIDILKMCQHDGNLRLLNKGYSRTQNINTDQNLENAARMQEMWENAMAEQGYEVKSTFYADLTLSETFGIGAIEETIKNMIDEWDDDVEFYTDLVLALHSKVVEHTERNVELAELYQKLLEVADKHARKTFVEDDIQYYFSQIN